MCHEYLLQLLLPKIHENQQSATIKECPYRTYYYTTMDGKVEKSACLLPLVRAAKMSAMAT